MALSAWLSLSAQGYKDGTQGHGDGTQGLGKKARRASHQRRAYGFAQDAQEFEEARQRDEHFFMSHNTRDHTHTKTLFPKTHNADALHRAHSFEERVHDLNKGALTKVCTAQSSDTSQGVRSSF